MQFSNNAETHFSYSRYLQETFGERVYKVVVASGLTCPTRDGSLAKKGCAFCDVRGSSSYFGKQGRGAGVAEQLARRAPQIRSRFGVEKLLAYFQSYTNTYVSPGSSGDGLSELREMYETALAQPGIVGLCIGTRPDCLPEPVLGLLQELAERHYVSLELGVQSFNDGTLEWLERGHDRACSLGALERLRRHAPAVHVCAHLMFGSPCDSADGSAELHVETAREAARLLNRSGVRGVKLHQLMILEGTELARRYRESPFSLPTLEEYSAQVAGFLSALSPGIYVERLCATATHSDECLAPAWSKDRWGPHNRLREWLLSRGIRQGQDFNPLSCDSPVLMPVGAPRGSENAPELSAGRQNIASS